MDVHSNAAVSGKPIEDFLPFHDNQEGGDGVSLEWLSIFVEDCLNGGFTTQPLPTPTTPHQTPNPLAKQGPETQSSSQPKAQKHPSAQGPSKAKANAKRRKVNNHHSDNNFFHTFHVNSSSSHPPLLPQGYWLADSQLLTFPKKDTPQRENVRGPPPQPVKLEEEEEEELEDVKVVVVKGHNDEEAQGPRRCTHCLSHKTPQWRAGPLGPRTLCNACGVRFKSGRLLPEYRPAKSPTFESFKHSNSHKKVMEMRMMATLLSSHTN